MPIRVQLEDFEISKELSALRAGNPKIGAIVSFVGLVRDINENVPVSEMTLDYYPGMTEKALAAIVEEAARRWNIYDALVIHRVGTLHSTDQIVLVAVAGAHRGDVFATCEFIMDYLKTRAPFWKKELTAVGEHWVEARDSDLIAEKRWI